MQPHRQFYHSRSCKPPAGLRGLGKCGAQVTTHAVHDGVRGQARVYLERYAVLATGQTNVTWYAQKCQESQVWGFLNK